MAEDSRATTLKAWAPYVPTAEQPWDLRRAVHLHRRAEFGAAWDQIERDLADGPQVSVTRVLIGAAASDPATREPTAAQRETAARDERTASPAGGDGAQRPQPSEAARRAQSDEFEHLARVIGDAAADSGSIERLKAWWLYRCLFTPHPLQERLTLLWHNHFATSNLKVRDVRLMRQQNDTFRRLALGPFGELLAASVHEPALLEFLDAPANRAGQPNENLGRELMELFTLGIGNYGETDIKEAARALTGWTVRQGQFRNQEAAHDAGEKTIFGKTGAWTGDDLVKILLERPATSRRLAWRLANEFCSDGIVDDAALDELAAGLAQHNLDIRWGVETILRSQRFFSDANIGTRVCDPVSYLVGPLVALEAWRDPPSTLVLAEWVGRMGQDLFHPPNVGGWNGGRAWLSTRTVVARANCTAALAAGNLASPPRPLDLSALVARHARSPHASGDADGGMRFLSKLLVGKVDEPTIATLPHDAAHPPALGTAVTTLLTSPAGHLH